MKAARVLPFHRTKPERNETASRRPNVAVPLFAAAFCLGVVVAAVGLNALQPGRGATVPAQDYQVATEARAAAEAAAAARLAALEDADALARRLVAALDSPPVSAADLASLRRDVTTATRTVERVRVVRVPVPGPTRAVASAQRRPQPARQPDRTPTTPAPTPARPCQLELLGTCLTR